MSTPVRSIIRSCIRKDEPLNIISFDCPEHYLIMLNELGHNIYVWDHIWRNPFCLKPNRINLLPNPSIPIDLDIDLVLFNSPHNVMQVIKFCHFWHVPVVSLAHNSCNLPRNHAWWKVKDVFGDIKVFSSKGIRESWDDYGYVIEPQFPQAECSKELITIASPQNPKESHLCQHFQKTGLINCILEGCLSYKKLTEILFASKYFINLNPGNHYVVLQALKSGCKVITVDYPLVHEYIKDKENGFIIQIPKDIENIISLDPDIKIGTNTEQDLEKFYLSWQNILESTVENIYIK